MNILSSPILRLCFAIFFLAGCSDDLENTQGNQTNSFKNAKELEDLRRINQSLQWENSRLKLVVAAYTVAGDDMVFSKTNSLWYFDMHREPFTGRAVNKFKDGTLKDEASFFKGKLDGVQRFHHPNGQIRLERQLRNGELHGYVTEWDTGGRILNRKRFEHNKEVAQP